MSKVGRKPSETDLIKSQISSETPRGKKDSIKRIIKDITSDSQVNSYFPYRWSPASLTFNIYFYLFRCLRITKNNDTSHLKSPKNQNRRAALGRPAIKLLGRGGGGGGASTSLQSTNPRPWLNRFHFLFFSCLFPYPHAEQFINNHHYLPSVWYTCPHSCLILPLSLMTLLQINGCNQKPLCSILHEFLCQKVTRLCFYYFYPKVN